MQLMLLLSDPPGNGMYCILQAARQEAVHRTRAQANRQGNTEVLWSAVPRQTPRSSVLPQSSLLLLSTSQR